MSFLVLNPAIELHEGYTNGLIVHLEKGFHFQIDSDMLGLLKKSINKPFQQKTKDIESKAIDYLLNHDILKISKKPSSKNTIRTPELRLHSIIHQNNIQELASILTKLESIHIFDYEIRIEESLNYERCTKLFQILDSVEIDNLDLLIRTESLSLNDMVNIVQDCQFYLNLYVFNSSIKESYKTQKISITPTDQEIDFVNSCGKINQQYFLFDEKNIQINKSHNACLRGKISVDPNGMIKHCPSMEMDYGSIHTTSLETLIQDSSFTKYWNIKKDSIQSCKDCEYRYVCTDCRAFTKNNEFMEKPSKCNYDPYAGMWK